MTHFELLSWKNLANHYASLKTQLKKRKKEGKKDGRPEDRKVKLKTDNLCCLCGHLFYCKCGGQSHAQHTCGGQSTRSRVGFFLPHVDPRSRSVSSLVSSCAVCWSPHRPCRDILIVGVAATTEDMIALHFRKICREKIKNTFQM